MIALARKTLAYEWRRFLPVVLAMCFAGVLLIVQAALVLGIFGTAAIYVKASSADIWAGFPGTQSVNYGHAISADVESHLRMDPDVTRVEPYEWVDGEWRSSAQGTGNVSVYLSGISTQDDAMMFGSSPKSGEGCTDFEEEIGVVSVSVGDALDDLDLVVDSLDQIRSKGPSAMSQDAWQIGL